ncbi:hypothetical protein AALA54_16550, partial [Oscillospiraceae bacterium 44-34]
MALYWSFLLPSSVCLAFTCFNQCFLRNRGWRHMQDVGKVSLVDSRSDQSPAQAAVTLYSSICFQNATPFLGR